MEQFILQSGTSSNELQSELEALAIEAQYLNEHTTCSSQALVDILNRDNSLSSGLNPKADIQLQGLFDDDGKKDPSSAKDQTDASQISTDIEGTRTDIPSRGRSGGLQVGRADIISHSTSPKLPSRLSSPDENSPLLPLYNYPSVCSDRKRNFWIYSVGAVLLLIFFALWSYGDRELLHDYLKMVSCVLSGLLLGNIGNCVMNNDGD